MTGMYKALPLAMTTALRLSVLTDPASTDGITMNHWHI